jgi:hypothetical protein
VEEDNEKRGKKKVEEKKEKYKESKERRDKRGKGNTLHSLSNPSFFVCRWGAP